MGKVPDYSLDGLQGLREEGEVGHAGSVKVGFDCQVVHHVPGGYSSSVACGAELEALFGHGFYLFVQLYQVCCRC
jgi:hypothetical protein